MKSTKVKSTTIKNAMILAAGRGTRLRPLTDTMPKPLVAINGRCLLDRILDRLAMYGIETVVLNLHYRGDMIADHLAHRSRPAWKTIREKTLLETGGGIKNALPHLGGDPFFVINGDILWKEGPESCLTHLAQHWDGRRMDCLLLLQPAAQAIGYDGPGDFFLDQNGIPRRRQEREVAPYVFAGIQILHPRLFKDSPSEPFSVNLLLDRAIASGRLRGTTHLGSWYHVGTPQSLAETTAILGEEKHTPFPG